MEDQLKSLIDPAFHGLLKLPAPDFKKMWLIRAFRVYARLHWRCTRTNKDFTKRKVSLRSASRKFRLEYFANQRTEGSRPCLLYFHGGAFVMPAFGHFKKHFASYALGADCDVLFVDYSLSPETKSKEILEQCRLAYQWLTEHASDMQVDIHRIAVGGDSAGGALAASLAQMVHDQHETGSLCGQMLIYPVIDDRCETKSMKDFYNSPFWSGAASEKMWPLYLEENSDYAVPMARPDLSSLPPAYVETAEIDPLRDEGMAYAQRLKEAGIPVTEHHSRRTMHGYDSVLESAITRESVSKRVEVLKEFFAQ